MPVFLLIACCWYAALLPSRLKLLNRCHWIMVVFCYLALRTSSLVCSLRLRQQHFWPASTRPTLQATCCCIQYPSHSIGYKHLLFAVIAMSPLKYCSWVWPEAANTNLHLVFPDNLMFQSHCQDNSLRCQVWHWKTPTGSTFVFPVTNAKSAEFSFDWEPR